MFMFIYVLSILLVGVIGVLVNVYLFWRFSKNRGGGFLTYCLAKTVPNTIVCSAFLFWVVPITALSLDYNHVPRMINVFVGQVAGFGAYIAGAILEMFMAINRCSVIYFSSVNFENANYVVTFVCIVSMVYVLLGLIPTSCGFVFDPECFLWRPEETECAVLMEDIMFYTICATFVVSNSLNLITFLKLFCFGKVEGISNFEIMRRRKRRIQFFAQVLIQSLILKEKVNSVIQNGLHMIDMINFNVISNLNDATWFKFIFTSLSLLTIHALDG
ncbi:hypothetical protein CRE_22851 [Caenorhabditis remanei]|uniref:7TM GPCR serpentine receptor class x (Srx) domain-containing protein n=1 Tax=Caenorhabditis remanei TaxID=31234 RepID=E3MHJ4_CAERE|nr:hypothetical protein CRE_22851 [Caenorhabditis remanei]